MLVGASAAVAARIKAHRQAVVACRPPCRAVASASSRRYWPKPTGNRMPTNELTTALGEAVAAVWGKLPDEVRQALFEAAIGSAGEGSREKPAIYLHGRHPRIPPSDKPGETAA